jgi:ActR/RegA family two-component response regulator
MELDCLVLSRDAELVRVLRPAMEQLSINVHIPEGVHSGHQMLLSHKFDGVVIDCDDLEDGLGMLRDVRNAPSNHSSVAFAIVNKATSASQALKLGANFVLQKPIEPVNADRCFSAALGLMMRERRRYFRVPVDMPITVVFSEGEQLKTRASNLSEGGMAAELPVKFTSSIKKILFTLPDTSHSIETRAELAWADGSGKGGIKFVELPQISKDHLESWLLQHIEKLQG